MTTACFCTEAYVAEAYASVQMDLDRQLPGDNLPCAQDRSQQHATHPFSSNVNLMPEHRCSSLMKRTGCWRWDLGHS